MTAILTLWLVVVMLLQYFYLILKQKLDPSSIAAIRDFHSKRQVLFVQLMVFMLLAGTFVRLAQHAHWPSYEIIISAELLWIVGWYLSMRFPEGRFKHLLNHALIVLLGLASLLLFIRNLL